MSKAGRKSGAGGRTISADEAELWSQATRTLDPVKAKPRVAPSSAEPPAGVRERPARAEKSKPPATPKPPPAREPAGSKIQAAPFADFDRRKVRQIGSGKIAIDARIDLHGLRQRDARTELRAFLLDAHGRGLKTVLVITGKGGAQEPDRLGDLLGEVQRGVLRRNVPRWLEEPDLKAVVLSYTSAGVRHGGEGALYVQLRKSARSGRAE
jgi:DNA-nicking Smr family endonuclease